ncbi:MAG TPA: XamI family restriction endonuclease [Candidatus Udaeobacter sp.]|nr:XamI family restriction endonuclease [Candidatus Udaeobacter sp.]
MRLPPIWTEKQLDAEAQLARSRFRAERLGEPLENWKQVFDRHKSQFERLFEEYGIAWLDSLKAEQIAAIFREHLGDALRYLAGPPISDDDLGVLAEVEPLTAARLENDSAAGRRVLATIVQALDTKRFPWVLEKRDPTDAEKSASILASAALITAQRLSTARRNESKKMQEQGVKDFLAKELAFKQVATRRIRILEDAPRRGEFCGESMVGTRKADILVRLFDGRLMPIECKVSNSSLNSVKRINNDAAVKARVWKDEFGRTQVVPVAMLTGVYKVTNLVQAQSEGLSLFWAHKLKALKSFIESTR